MLFIKHGSAMDIHPFAIATSIQFSNGDNGGYEEPDDPDEDSDETIEDEDDD